MALKIKSKPKIKKEPVQGKRTPQKTELEKQAEYALGQSSKGEQFGLAVGSAFVESMRNTYYRHTGTALDELIDNSIESGAKAIHIALGYLGKSKAKPDAIAVIDNGHGMIPEMLRFAVQWGGTHREDQRSGLGRFGFGLPSASVNQCRCYSVYSKPLDGEWNAITVDLDKIRDRVTEYYDDNGRIVAPKPKKAELPDWVRKYIQTNYPGKSVAHGTVVVWEKPDRLDWTTTAGLTTNLLQHFGITFRNYLSAVDIVFDGRRVEATDPLFITPGARFFDLDEDRAEARPGHEVFVTHKKTGEKHPIKVRYATMPPSFYAKDKERVATGKNQNERWRVAMQNNGLIVCRMGRQIDVINNTPWPGFERFRNNDRYLGVEIDFPAELDEEFAIANSKQGVVVRDRIWEILRENGVFAALQQLRKDYVQRDKARANQTTNVDDKRPSEKAMEESEKFKAKRVHTPSPEREQKAREALEQFAKQRAKETQRNEDEVKEEVEQETLENRFKVDFEHLEGAPFFRVKQIGGMQVLYINRAHNFYSELYAAPESSRRTKAALEVLLFSIGECELDAVGNSDREAFYNVERQEWSQRLNVALKSLGEFIHQVAMPNEDEMDHEV